MIALLYCSYACAITKKVCLIFKIQIRTSKMSPFHNLAPLQWLTSLCKDRNAKVRARKQKFHNCTKTCPCKKKILTTEI